MRAGPLVTLRVLTPRASTRVARGYVTRRSRSQVDSTAVQRSPVKRGGRNHLGIAAGGRKQEGQEAREIVRGPARLSVAFRRRGPETVAGSGIVGEHRRRPQCQIPSPGDLTFAIARVYFSHSCPHRLEAQDSGFSVRQQGFESPWGYLLGLSPKKKALQWFQPLQSFFVRRGTVSLVARH